MSIWSMVLREIAYRKGAFLIGVIGIAVAIALLVGVLTSLQMHTARSDELVSLKEEQTRVAMDSLRSDLRKAMQRLGYNALILPRDQSLGDLYAEDYAAHSMPESWATRLDGTAQVVDRYLPQLRRKLTWGERQWTVLIVGVGAERILDTSVCEDVPLVPAIERGCCVLGYELHHALGLSVGEEITVAGHPLRVQTCEQELGTKDDISIWVNLADAQALTDQPGRINEILIVEHLSVWGDVAEVRRRVAEVLPECQVVEIASDTLSRAHARIKVAEEARASLEQEREARARLDAARRGAAARLVPLGFLTCAVWIGVLMYVNVRQRAAEIGVLRALGFHAGDVRRLILSKACLLGVVGGLVGFVCGAGGVLLFEARAAAGVAIGCRSVVSQFGLAEAMAVAACVVGSWIPAGIAGAMDPAEILNEE